MEHRRTKTKTPIHDRMKRFRELLASKRRKTWDEKGANRNITFSTLSSANSFDEPGKNSKKVKSEKGGNRRQVNKPKHLDEAKEMLHNSTNQNIASVHVFKSSTSVLSTIGANTSTKVTSTSCIARGPSISEKTEAKPKANEKAGTKSSQESPNRHIDNHKLQTQTTDPPYCNNYLKVLPKHSRFLSQTSTSKCINPGINSGAPGNLIPPKNYNKAPTNEVRPGVPKVEICPPSSAQSRPKLIKKSLAELKQELSLKSYTIPKVKTEATSPGTILLNAILHSNGSSDESQMMEIIDEEIPRVLDHREVNASINSKGKKMANERQQSIFGSVSSKGVAFDSSATDSAWSDLAESGDWFLVMDTNIFIHCLKFIQEIMTKNVPGLGFPVVYVPLIVIRELDSLKEKLSEQSTRSSVRSAINFINKCLVVRHPRIKGQTWNHYHLMTNDGSLCGKSNPDDKILLCGLQLRKYVPKKVVLISNDNNLRNKGLIEDLESFSVDEFEDYLSDLTMAAARNRSKESKNENKRESTADIGEGSVITGSNETIPAARNRSKESKTEDKGGSSADIGEGSVITDGNETMPAARNRSKESKTENKGGSSADIGEGSVITGANVTVPALETVQTVVQELQEDIPTDVDKAFQEILTTCWTIVNSELQNIRTVLQNGTKNVLLEQNLVPAIGVMVQLIAALKGSRLMYENGVQSVAAIQQLATALSAISGVHCDAYVPVLIETSPAGKSLIIKAEEVFSAMLEEFKAARAISANCS